MKMIPSRMQLPIFLLYLSSVPYIVDGSSTDLANIPSKLESLCNKLHRDTDIQNGVRQLATQSRNCVSEYNSMIKSEGNTILTQKQLLANTMKPNEVDTKKMSQCLAATVKQLETIRSKVIERQTETHSLVESCRARKMQHESKILNKRASISSLQGQISSAESEIQSCEADIAKFNQGAGELDNRAGDIERAGRRSEERGIFGIIGGIAGIIFAPVTGGASLALTAAGVATAGVNFNDANDCRRNAGKLRNDAEARRQQAANLRTKISSLQNQISSARSEISDLETAISNLNEAMRGLEEVTDSLRDFLDVINNVLSRFQNVETCLKDTMLQTDSFRIVQIAFGQTKAEKLPSSAQKYLDQLKEKWTAMETILLQNGARAIST